MDSPSVKYLNLPFTDAISFFRDKIGLPSKRWDDLWQGMHSRSFVVAGAMKGELLGDLREAVDKAISKGTTLAEFRKDFDALVAKHGWNYKGNRGWRTAVIYNTNLSTAYAAGHYAQMTDPDVLAVRPYWKYLPSHSAHRRIEHMQWYGIVLPHDDPWWNTHYPPNGWGCKCGVISMSRREYERTKDKLRTEAPDDGTYEYVNKRTGVISQVPRGIDPGWDYNPGKDDGYKVLFEKLETMPNDLARTWFARIIQEPAFERFIAGKILSDFPVAVLRPEDMALLGAKNQTVWLSAESLAKNKGDLPSRSAGHPDLTLDDYRMIPKIIDEGEVYKHSDERLIYLQIDGMLYRAAVKRTKDGMTNYLLSLMKVPEGSRAGLQVREKYEKLR